MSDQHPLVSLYGDNALDSTAQEIKDLAKNSNIPFDKKYVDLGISFVMIKAGQIVEGKKQKCSLQSLVSEGFGEAAIYTYNINNSVLE